MIVQLYGVTTPEDAAMVNASGADHVGVVLDEGVPTWDSVDEPTLRQIIDELTDVDVVALSLSTDLERIRRTVEAVEPDIVHLARAAGGLTPEDVLSLREQIAPVAIMTTAPVVDPTSIELGHRLALVSDYLLLDSRDPANGIVGATGLTHDWSLSRQVVRDVAPLEVPVILAGGLGPDNVVEAMTVVRPAGVDSETHTSRADDRRRKDPVRVARFVALARSFPSDDEPNDASARDDQASGD